MFHSELEMLVHYEELRREADEQRLVREATEALRAAAVSPLCDARQRGDQVRQSRVRRPRRGARRAG